MPDKRVTQQDIADRAGLNRATVSLAIRNHPSIALKTRQRVQELAEALGYRPDPMLSALAAYRNSRQAPEFRGVIAWLARTTLQFQWRRIEHFMRYLEGAKRQADRLGYKIQIVDLDDQGIRWERAASILRAQGIAGILLCPQPRPDTKLETFPWREFSAVKFGYSVTHPQLQMVAPAQFRAAQTAVMELKARGYQRIGFVGKRSHDERTGHNYFGGFLSALTFDRWQELVPPCWLDTDDPQELIGWFEREKPDALMVSMEYHYRVLHDHGYRAPRDFGVVCPATGDSGLSISGVADADERIGETAVDMLVSMMHRGERDTPPSPQRLLVEGRWVEGTTLRPAPAGVLTGRG